MRFLLAAIPALFALSLAPPAQAAGVGEWVRGPVQVVDGDTLAMGKHRVRLHGIDAPETSQSCYKNGAAWACGKAASWELSRLISGKQVDCLVKDQDQYGRLVSVCQVGGVSLNAAMVESGWALAYARYAKDFLPQQARAKATGLGIWTSQWSSPEQFRRQNRNNHAR